MTAFFGTGSKHFCVNKKFFITSLMIYWTASLSCPSLGIHWRLCKWFLWSAWELRKIETLKLRYFVWHYAFEFFSWALCWNSFWNLNLNLNFIFFSLHTQESQRQFKSSMSVVLYVHKKVFLGVFSFHSLLCKKRP